MAPSSDDSSSSSSSSSQSSPSNGSKDSSSNSSSPSGGDSSSSSSSNNGGNGNSGSSNNNSGSNNGGNDSSGGSNSNNSGGNSSGGNNSNSNNSGGNNSGGNGNSGGGDNGDKDSGGNNSSGGNSNSGQNSNNSGQNNNNSGQNNTNNNSGQNNNNSGQNNNNGNQNNNNNSGQNNNNSGQNNNNNNNQGNQNQNQNQNHNNNNNWNAPPPPPPPPPPPHGRKSPPKAIDSNDSPTPSSKSNSTPVIVGCVAGAGLLLFVLIALFLACTKRKKKRQSTHLMDNPGRPNGTGSDYWQSGPYKPNGHEHILNMPPPPALASSGWNGRGNQPPMVSSEMNSSNFSGPAGPPLPPPHPSVALGFNTSTFSYDDLAAATSGFSHAKLLGQGGFGFVHKGVLPNGKEIAVKSLKSGSGQGDREFAAEVEIISRVHHRHLVSLVGYCLAGDRKLLVYEFVPNNNLEFHLYSKNRPPLDWASRVKIALGSAKGLAYLHEDCHPKIIHRDIKAANILIDHNFEAKVADFGLAKLNQENVTHVSTRVMGTFGYLAPEYASSGKLTEKSDVFSFGIMLLELITGRRPVDTTGEYEEDTLVDWARPLCVKAMEDRNYNELVDPRLENNYNHEEMARMVACASTSVRQSAKKRPKMSQIVRVLEGDVSLEDLHDGIKPSPSSLFGGSATSSEFDTDSYNSNMKNFRKTSPLSGESQDFPSSEYGASNSDEIVKKV